MRKYWILTSLGLLSIVIALVVGFTPVHSSLLIGANENGPGGHPSISCGSPLIKRPPSYSPPFTGMRLEDNDPCSLARDHRRLPVKIAGGAGLVVAAAGSIGLLVTRRRATPSERPSRRFGVIPGNTDP